MKIVFLDEYSVGGANIESIKRLGDYIGYEISTTPEQIIERCRDADIIITNKCLLTRAVLESLPHLCLVCIAATGINNIDSEAAGELGIEIRNAVGYSTHSVAEATLSSALTLLRSTTYFDRFVKSGEYSSSDRLFCHDRTIGQLHNSRWGIIGLGTIGREVARLASAFGCEVRYFSTSGHSRPEEYERAETLQELLEWCDILSLHAPLNDQTRNLIGAKELTQMQPHAIVVNVARGGIIDEVALCNALNNNKIAAAALDVYSHEPLEPNSPLLTIDDSDKLLLSPHNAWASRLSIERLIESITQNIIDFTSL